MRIQKLVNTFLLLGNRIGALPSRLSRANAKSSISVSSSSSLSWSPFLDTFQVDVDPMCMQTLHIIDDPYPPVYMGFKLANYVSSFTRT